MRSLKAFGEGRLELVEEETPSLGVGEVLIKPILVGICGTDLDIVHNKIDPMYVNYPVTLGHEWCGLVTDCAPDIKNIFIGERVVVQGIIPCERCHECLSGNTNRCEIYDEYGFTRDGAGSSAVVAVERLIHKISDLVSDESAALVEPAAVVATGLLKSNPASGAKVLIIGDGTIGLLAAKLMRSWLPAQIDMIGMRSQQAQLAKLANVDNFRLTSTANSEKYDLVIEASGSKIGVEMALKKIVRGGKLLILGFIGHEVSIPLVVDDIVNGDFSIYGSFGYTSKAWAKTVALLNSGDLDLTFLVTHRFALSDWQKALDALATAPAPRGKVILIP
jgi:2-desacetyl-2-hydroxyethyl bacteriochlorophyllide A dehydrogenase